MSKPQGNCQLSINVLDNLEDAVVAFDQQEKVTLINPMGQNFLGFSEKQAIGASLEKVVRKQETLLYLVRTSLSETRSIADHENIVLHTTGLPPRPVSATVSPLYSPEGKLEGTVLMMHDLTRVRELEEAIQRADRLSMLGTLAAGLAHEIKNPLGGIKGAAQLLAMELGENPDLQEYPQVMVREVERVNTIIEELLNLGNPRSLERVPVNLSQILNDIVLLQQEAVHDREVRFQLHLDPSIPPIVGDPDLLTQLFLNLIKNAGEAIDQHGQIEITTRVSSESHRNKPSSRPQPMIRVEISDNGKGISAEEQERIFTPFYTTKRGGSGLGMAICQKIVSDHDGLLKVESQPGQGTQVTVALPLST